MTLAASRRANAAVASTEKAFRIQRSATVTYLKASMPMTNDFSRSLFIGPPYL